MSRFYVTTPIYYINDVPHLGSAYTTVAADVLARYHELRGEPCRFLTGTDEHGLKIQRVAQERGLDPRALADEVSVAFRDAWPRLSCIPDDFIRTSEARHARGVQELWRKIQANGDIYLGKYEGLYCVGCEAYYTEKDLEQPGDICKIHGTAAERVEEESYFFRLSRYGDRLLELYAKNPEFVQPAGRMNEVKSFVEAGLTDLSVSRTTFRWGIPVPDDERHVMYVWFDALANYLTALGGEDEHRDFWPADVHLVGKDILRFHAVFWPAFLLAAGYEDKDLPRRVFAHGFLTYGGQKMSKSLRNTISPVALAEAVSPTVGVDTLRYCLMRAISFGQDGDFSVSDMLQRYSSELGNALGNLLNRILPFASAVPSTWEPGPFETELSALYAKNAPLAAEMLARQTSPTRALEAIWGIVMAANAYVDKAAPWVAKKNDPARLDTIVAMLVRLLEGVAVMISPVMPTVADLVRAQLGLPKIPWRAGTAARADAGPDLWPMELPPLRVGAKLERAQPIFPRLEKEHEAELVARFSPPAKRESATEPTPAEPKTTPAAAPAAAASAEDAAKAPVDYDEFARLDLRVGRVASAARIPRKDRLLDLRVEVGEPEPRRIVAGIAAAYAPEALTGRRVLVLCNLPPRDFGKGLVSHGMLLAAGQGETLRLVDVPEGPAPGDPVK